MCRSCQSVRCAFFLLLAVASLTFVLAIDTHAAPLASRLASRIRAESVDTNTPVAATTADAAADANTDPSDPFNQYRSALSAAMVAAVNGAPNVTWTAGMNEYFEDKDFAFLKQSCGTKIDPQLVRNTTQHT